jgi:hypothetical protein
MNDEKEVLIPDDESNDDGGCFLADNDDGCFLADIGLALMLIDRKLFETLFKLFRRNPNSDECKKKALEYIETAARHRHMDPQEYLDLLSDFFCWLKELMVVIYPKTESDPRRESGQAPRPH